MNEKEIKVKGNMDDGQSTSVGRLTFTANSISSLKSIANKSPDAYQASVKKTRDEEVKRKKKAEAEMATSSFRAQPFVSPFSGKNKRNSYESIVAHGVYDGSAGKIIEKKAPILLTEEALANATFTPATDLGQLLAKGNNFRLANNPIPGRVLFTTPEGDFEIDAELVRVKLAESSFEAPLNQALFEVLEAQAKRQKKEIWQRPQRHAFNYFSKPGTNSTLEDATDLAPSITQNGDDSEIQPATVDIPTDEISEADDPFPFNEPGFDEEVINEADHEPVVEKALPPEVFYDVPSFDLLDQVERPLVADDDWLLEKSEGLEQIFTKHNLAITVTGNYLQNGTLTQFELVAEKSAGIADIQKLESEIFEALKVTHMRLVTNVVKGTIGIEIPNQSVRRGSLKELLNTTDYIFHESPLVIGLGKNIADESVLDDLQVMPHCLIGGQKQGQIMHTLHVMLLSILFKSRPEDVKMLLIDPSASALMPYDEIPHLLQPVISKQQLAVTALKWLTDELNRRLQLFETYHVRDIKRFNKRRFDFEQKQEKLPFIIVAISELAQFLYEQSEMEEAILTLIEKGKVAGIHIIMGTHRPSTPVLTDKIRASIGAQLVFAVKDAHISKVLLGTEDAQQLLPVDDMLYGSRGKEVMRLQPPVVSHDELQRVVDFVKSQGHPSYVTLNIEPS